MSNIQDVAKRAGVSVATVSRVLNHSAVVLPKTEQQVYKAVAELNYKPLRVQKHPPKPSNIMVLIPDISNNFYSVIVEGIGDYCVNTGRNMLLCNTNYSRKKELEFLDMMKNNVAQGVIFFDPELYQEELLRISEKYPVIQCCEYLENVPISHISIDNKAATKEAMRHLLGLGHTRIGLITGHNSFLSTKQREKVYYQTLEEHNLPIRKEYVIAAHKYDFKNGLRAMKQLLQLDEPPTAVFALSDFLAIGAVFSAKSAGLKVPDDIAVMGFDGIDYAAMYMPSITTVSQPCYDLGYNAMDMLSKKIDGLEERTQSVFLEHELKIRASTVKM